LIIDAIVIALKTVLNGFLALIPEYELPAMGDFGSTLGASVGAINGYFPVVTLGVCLLTILGVRVFIGLFNVLVFVYGLIPFKAT
jgi:hypothetical protein